MKKLFPTHLPYATKQATFIPDDMNLKINLIGNDLMYLIAHYCLKNPKTTDKKYAKELLNKCKKSRTTEWRRRKRLKAMELI